MWAFVVWWNIQRGCPRIAKVADPHIPQQQFGFRIVRSCLQAMESLLNDIKEALRTPKQKYYTIFIDYTKAFDSINRQILAEKDRAA
jgi:hypothetical protein